MANHYSGKRAAGRKPVGKRALSLLMALVMSLSLVQITAFAVETDQSKQVTNPGDTVYYKADGTEGSENDWAVKLSRTLTETSTENLFNVDLEVTTKDNTVSADAEAAAVLVIDTSGSMGYCTVCGEEGREEGQDHGATGYQWVYECDSKPGSYWADADGNDVCDNCGKEAYEWDWFWGWVSTHTEKRIPVGAHPFQSRLTAAKKAAKDFLDDYAKNASGSTSTKPRYVAVVEYAKDAYTRVTMVDVTNQKDREEAKEKIDTFKAGGGTNTEAGLQLASNLLAGRKTENKFVVLLTDGEPTYAIGENGTRTGTAGPIPGSGWNHYINDGRDTSKEVNGPVETISTQLKTAGVHVFGVVYGLTKEDGTMETVPNSKGDAVAIDTWMKNDCQMEGVFKANSTDALNTAFKAIINTIQHETVGTTVATSVHNQDVSDALSGLYTFVQFTNQNGATEENNEVNWDLSKADPAVGTTDTEKTYTMSYQVWMGTETKGFEEETPYSLGAATLSFKVNDGEPKNVAFPYVAAKGYLGGLDFTKVERVGNEFAPLSGAEFQLAVAEGSTFGHTRPLEGTSNDKGAVAISNIPSGYTYTLSETKAPEGYVQTDKTWTVTVSYGEVTVTEAANPNDPTDPTTGDAIENLMIENTKIPPADASYQVVHAYYNGETLVHATEPVTVNAKEGDVVTSIQQEPVYDGVTYTFKSMDKVLPWTLEAGNNGVVTLRYEYEEKIPEDASYQVVHAYYNGETLVHATEPVTVSAKEGDVVTSIQQEPVYDGVTYTFKSMDKVLPWTLEAGDNGVVTLRYEYEEKIPEDASYQVVHAYYNGETLVHATEPVTVSAKEGDVVTSIQQEPVYDGVTYTFKSMDKTLPWTLEAGDNGVVTLRYEYEEKIPEDASYQVVHAYYENGTLVHETEPVTVSAKEGDVVTSIQQEPVYNGVTYSFTSMDKTLPWTLEAGNNGTVTLRYDRTYNPPVGPSYTYYTVTVNYYDKDSGEVIHTAYTTTQREYTAYDVTAQDKIAITGYTYVETTGDALTGTLNGNKVINVYYTKDSSIDDGNTPTDPGTDIGDDDVPVTPAQPPKTGDSMGLWIAAAMVSGMGLIWLFLSGKKRKEEI